MILNLITVLKAFQRSRSITGATGNVAEVLRLYREKYCGVQRAAFSSFTFLKLEPVKHQNLLPDSKKVFWTQDGSRRI